jgi:hypothetical protein
MVYNNARSLTADAGVADHCTFIECDMRKAIVDSAAYDAALFLYLYAQLAVFRREEAADLLRKMAAAYGMGCLCTTRRSGTSMWRNVVHRPGVT